MDLKALNDALAAVSTAETNLNGADSAKAAAQTKFDAAQASKATADQSDIDAKAAFNTSLDTLIQTATAAKLS